MKMAPSTATTLPLSGSRAHSSDTQNQESYSTMDQSDVEAIGAHCQFAYCHQLDFLPFRCESCRGTFCLDHRTESSHSCPKAGLWARERAARFNSSSTPSTTSSTSSTLGGLSSQNPQICASPECKSPINTPRFIGVHCPNCQREYCLKHRFRDEHSCSKLVPLGARSGSGNAPGVSSSSAEKAKIALARLRSWGREKQSSLTTTSNRPSNGAGAGIQQEGKTMTTTITSWTRKAPSSTAARINALNDLKRTAKGDSKIPAQRRIYVHVEASSEVPPSSSSTPSPTPASSTTTSSPNTTSNTTTTQQNQTSKEKAIKSEKLFFDKTWKIGRALDVAAKSLQIPNLNNSGAGEEGRLRIYHVEGGRVLEFGEVIGEAVGEANTLVLLRGIGPGS